MNGSHIKKRQDARTFKEESQQEDNSMQIAGLAWAGLDLSGTGFPGSELTPCVIWAVLCHLSVQFLVGRVLFSSEEG